MKDITKIKYKLINAMQDFHTSEVKTPDHYALLFKAYSYAETKLSWSDILFCIEKAIKIPDQCKEEEERVLFEWEYDEETEKITYFPSKIDEDESPRECEESDRC